MNSIQGESPMAEVLQDVRALALVEELHVACLRQILDALAHAEIPVLLMKGTALAYSHYEDAFLRPRLDTDLFISRDHFETAIAVFNATGYQQMPSNYRVHHQVVFTKRDRRGIRHVFDLHSRPLSPVALHNILSFPEAWQECVAVPRIGTSAQRLSDAHSLLLACTHWAGHHFLTPHDHWLQDIVLLTKEKTPDWWMHVQDLFIRKKVARIGAAILDAVEATGRHTGLPASVLQLWNSTIGETETRYFLRKNRTRLTDFWWDLRCLGTWRERVALLRNHLFPPADFMQSQHGDHPQWTTAYFHLLRIKRGLWKLATKTRP